MERELLLIATGGTIAMLKARPLRERVSLAPGHLRFPLAGAFADDDP